MTLEPGSIANWASAATAIFAIVYTLISTRSRAGRDHVQNLELRIHKNEQAIERLQIEVAHLPNSNDMHAIRLGMARMEGQLSTIEERLKPLASISERMQDFLMSGDHK